MHRVYRFQKNIISLVYFDCIALIVPIRDILNKIELPAKLPNFCDALFRALPGFYDFSKNSKLNGIRNEMNTLLTTMN